MYELRKISDPVDIIKGYKMIRLIDLSSDFHTSGCLVLGTSRVEIKVEKDQFRRTSMILRDKRAARLRKDMFSSLICLMPGDTVF